MSSPTIDQPSSTLGANTAAYTAALPSARSSRFVDASCRALDIVGALLLLILTAPLLVAIAIAIRLDSPGPAVFRQQRIGRGRRPFTVNKFRSMFDGAAHDRHREFVLGLIRGDAPRHSSGDPPPYSTDDRDTTRENGNCAGSETPTWDDIDDDSAPPYYKMVTDPRVTRVGRLLRRSSLDELPQLWNVLRGDMSLVGPRPPIPYEVEHYPSAWFDRFAVKPGITGLWQVSGRSTVTIEEMIRLDIEYAHRRTLWLNLSILIRTVPAVLGARGAW